MSRILEERILNYIKENSIDGRILIKLDDLANGLNDARGPVYAALMQLKKKRKIRTENRSRMGIEISLTDKNTSSINTEQNPEEEPYDSSPELFPFDILLSNIRLLDLNQLVIVSEYIHALIGGKKGGKKL